MLMANIQPVDKFTSEYIVAAVKLLLSLQQINVDEPFTPHLKRSKKLQMLKKAKDNDLRFK